MKNREIKFRAWDGEEMHDVIEYSAENCRVPLRRFPFSESIVPEEVMQYTGLKDKEGKEIYEGDILQTGKEKQVIEFSSEIYVPSSDQSYYASYHWGYRLYSKNYIVFNPEQCKIIGNIYENPELLEK